jgi:mannose-1-phosphate guanylyltransferase/phosphomannomutase
VIVDTVAIVAGGFGTRMGSNFSTPKSLLEVDGKAILQHQVQLLSSQGVTNFILLLGNQHKEIKEFCMNKIERKNLKFSYIVESKPLGTGGALLNAVDEFPEYFYFIYGDIFVDVNISKLNIVDSNSRKIECTYFYHPSSHPLDSNVVVLEEGRSTLQILDKGGYSKDFRNTCLAGVYLLSREFLLKNLKLDCSNSKIDFELDILMKSLPSKNIVGIRNTEIIRDLGTPQRLESFERNVYRPEVFRPAIFLDRDGVINLDLGHIDSIERFELIPEAIKAIANLKQLGFIVVVVTNQPAIARGTLTFDTLETFHALIDFELSHFESFIDQFYVCPHHPDSGYLGEVHSLKINCDCRKPKTGLLKRAIEEFKIDLSNSWMVGDSERDIEAGISFGIKTAYISAENKSNLVGADKTFANLMDFVKYLNMAK